MAIQIDSSLNLTNGVTVGGSYLRVDYLVNQYGNKINYKIYPYLNRDIYMNDKRNNINRKNNILSISGFKSSDTIEYDKDVDGDNILQIVSNEVFSYVTADETYQRAVIDPSTGLPIIDPSTGMPETETVIIHEKFALPQDVSIIDID